MTLDDLLEQARRQLDGAGVADPRRETLTLWAALAGVSAGGAWLRRHDPPDPTVVDRYREAVRQRAAGMPVAYAAGTAAFRTLELTVDERVLIPRPETEGLVQQVLDRSGGSAAARSSGWGVAADVGTGSGAIALSLAVEGKFERIIATDSSPGALELARANSRATAAGGTAVEFRLGSLLEPLRGEAVDVLVSNPPYVSESEWAALDAGVRDYEPRAALVSGPDGMAHTRALLRDGPAAVRPGGLIALEVDCRRAGAVLALARQDGWVDARVERDLFGRERYLLATRGMDD